MGVVWEARDLALDRSVAVKCMLRPDDPALVQRFEREAAMLAGVQHPGVLRLYTHGRTRDGVYLVTELLEGQALPGTPDEATAVAALLEVAAALEELHRLGLVHRDVKPDNIFVTRDGRGVLMDLGLARDHSKTRLTSTGQLVGTLVYMAPELLRGGEAGEAADWYGWGASLYERLEGRPPFTFDTLMSWASLGQALPEPEFSALGGDHPARGPLIRLLGGPPEARAGAAHEICRALARQSPAAAPRAPALPRSASQPGARSGPRVRLASSSSAGQVRAGGEAAGPRRAAALTLGLVALAAGAWWLRPPPAAPAPAPAPAPGSPGGAAPSPRVPFDGELAAAARELLEGHRREDCEVAPCPPRTSTFEHADGLREELLDIRLGPRVHRLLVHFGRWRRRLAPEDWQDDGLRRWIWEATVEVIRHLDGDLGALNRIERADSIDRLERMAAARRNRSELETLVEGTVRELMAEEPRPDPFVWRLAAGLSPMIPAGQAARLAEVLVEEFRGRPGKGDRGLLANGALRLLRRALEGGQIECGLARETAIELLLGLPGGLDRDELEQAVHLLERLVSDCPGAANLETFEVLRGALVEADPELRLDFPALHALGKVFRRLMDLPEVRRRGDQVRHLQGLWWWREAHLQLRREPVDTPAAGSFREDAARLAEVLAAAEGEATAAPAVAMERLEALHRPVLAACRAGRLAAQPEVLARLVAEASRLGVRARAGRGLDPARWARHVAATNGFLWRLLRPLEAPAPVRFVLSVAFSRQVPFVGDRMLYSRAYFMVRDDLDPRLEALVVAAQARVEDPEVPWRRLFAEHEAREGVLPTPCGLWRGAAFAAHDGSVKVGINSLLEGFDMYQADHVADALQCTLHCGLEPCPIDPDRLRRELGTLGSTTTPLVRTRMASLCPEIEGAVAQLREPPAPEVARLVGSFREACAGAGTR